MKIFDGVELQQTPSSNAPSWLSVAMLIANSFVEAEKHRQERVAREAGSPGTLDEVMAQAVMMRGRMVHFLDGRTDLQRYGKDDSEVIWSVHRGELNLILLDLAERAGARLHFHHGLAGVDFDARIAHFKDDRDGSVHEVPFESLVGADGAGC